MEGMRWRRTGRAPRPVGLQSPWTRGENIPIFLQDTLCFHFMARITLCNDLFTGRTRARLSEE